MAIDYSDGVIEAGSHVDPELLKYAEEKNIPLLKNPGENFEEAYKDFFDKIGEME